MLNKICALILTSIFCACSLKPVAPPAPPRDDAQTPYLGVELGGLATGPNIPQVSALESVILRTILINGPAWSAGLRPGDMVTKINKKPVKEFSFKSPDDFKKYISTLKVGETVTFEILRKSVSGELLRNGHPLKKIEATESISALDYINEDLDGGKLNAQWNLDAKKFEILLKLQGRNYGFGESPPTLTSDYKKLFKSEENPFLLDVSARFKVLGDDAGTADLLRKLSRLSESGDSLRPQAITYLQRNPLQLQSAVHWARRRLHDISLDSPLADAAAISKQLGGYEIKSTPPAKSRGAIEDLASSLKKAKGLVNEAASDLTSFRIQHLKQNLPQMAIRLIDTKYLQSDLKASQIQKLTDDFIDITKIHQQDLVGAAEVLSARLTRSELGKIKSQAARLLKANNDKPVTLESEVGSIMIFGKEDNRHLAGALKNVALLIDMGGDDWYGDVSCAIIDFDGNDTYEATGDFTTGASVLDANFLIDVDGDDRYVGRYGVFGATLFGVALHWDGAGHDQTRCLSYCNGVAFGGVGIYADDWGNDRYEAHQLSQGVAIAGGFALLADLAGSDQYYGKGDTPTGYGDPGQFDGWSQGVGLGLRGFVSGGVAFLYDRSGIDYYEGGNFSQGGGYYFGWGTLLDDGKENDVYVTSRYGQGFAAHYAIGSFFDAGGNDRHLSRDSVAQGMAWDMSLTHFEDLEGNDNYRTCEHCLGVASNNSIATFIDHSGDDLYSGKDLPLDADVENNYHDGISLGLFLDRAGSDTYEKMKNHSSLTRKKYHLVIDE